MSKQIIVYERKAKQQQPKPAAKQKKKTKKRLGPRLGKCTLEYARSLSNPFDYSSCVPDGSTNAGVFSIKQTYTLNTGTGTCTGMFFNPQPSAYVISDIASTSLYPTVAGNFSAATANATVAAQYAKYRTVSMGVRANFIGNTQTDGGVIVAGIVSGSVAPSSFNGVTLTALTSLCMQYKCVALRAGVELKWFPSDVIDTTEFYPTSTSAVAVSSTFTLPYLIVYVFGAESSALVLQVDHITNFEGQYKQSTLMPGGIDYKSQAPAEVGWYENARALLAGVDAIVPMAFSSNIGKALGGAAMQLANGYMYPQTLSSARTPRLH